jgi:hypothetical protein
LPTSLFAENGVNVLVVDIAVSVDFVLEILALVVDLATLPRSDKGRSELASCDEPEFVAKSSDLSLTSL